MAGATFDSIPRNAQHGVSLDEALDLTVTPGGCLGEREHRN